MLWGAGLAGLSWLAFAFAPHRYLPFMAVMTALNLALVFVNVVVGGLQVEILANPTTGQGASRPARRSRGRCTRGAARSRAGSRTRLRLDRVDRRRSPCFRTSHRRSCFYREPRQARPTRRSARRRPRTASKAARLPADVDGDRLCSSLFYLCPGSRSRSLPPTGRSWVRAALHRHSAGRWPGSPASCGRPALRPPCRRTPLRISLVAGIVLERRRAPYCTFTTTPPPPSAVISSSASNGSYASLVPLYDLAARATPKGSESFAFGLMIERAQRGHLTPSPNYGRGLASTGTSRLQATSSGSTPSPRWPSCCSFPFFPRISSGSRERTGPP